MPTPLTQLPLPKLLSSTARADSVDTELLIRTVLSCGALKAAPISQDQIVLSETFRTICESNQCGGYDRCWKCPPYVGSTDEVMKEVRRYPQAILYQTVAEIEDSFDIEGMFDAGKAHAQISQKINEAVKPLIPGEFLHLSCGGCHLCDTCAKLENKPCRMPDKALAGMEAYCIDVYQTSLGTPLKYINGQNTVTYFGILLYGV